MKSYTIAALGIALKIWLAALLCNTFFGSLILSGASGGFLDFLIFGGFFGSLFSAPVFLLLWSLLYFLFKAGRTAAAIFKIILVTGSGLAFVAWLIFSFVFDFGFLNTPFLGVLASVSGAAGISANYPAIKNACLRRDEDRMILENFCSEQPGT